MLRMKFLLMVLALSLPVTVTTQADVLQMAVPDDAYPPYVIHNEQGEAIHGLLIDPLRQALATLDMKLELLELPILRSTYMLAAGQLEARMESPHWITDAGNFLWVEPGVWLEDVLIYRADLPFVPDSMAALEGSEVITHLGYIYPALDPLFNAGKLTRLDKHTERDMIETLLNAPAESPRLLVMERRVWEWHKARIDIPPHIRLQVSPLVIGCASLQLQLALSVRARTLQPKLQQALQQQRPLPAVSPCQSAE